MGTFSLNRTLNGIARLVKSLVVSSKWKLDAHASPLSDATFDVALSAHQFGAFAHVQQAQPASAVIARIENLSCVKANARC
jgi:hypothetical protein